MKPQFGFCFRPLPKRNDCSGPLMIWIHHRGRTCFVTTSCDVRHDEWDPLSGTLVAAGKTPDRKPLLEQYARKMERTLRAVATLIADLATADADADAEQKLTAAKIARACRNLPDL